jgi:hypothetical protein
MAGLDPAIQALGLKIGGDAAKEAPLVVDWRLDGRVKPGHDAG